LKIELFADLPNGLCNEGMPAGWMIDLSIECYND